MKKFKRIAAATLALVMALLLFPAQPLEVNAATSGTCGDNLTWTLDDAGTLTISGTGAMYSYDWCTSPWNDDSNIQSNIKNVIIGDNVTTIGSYAFYACGNLTKVTIGNSVSTIGERAFSYCERLTEMTIPSSVTTIGDHAFFESLYYHNVTIYYAGTNAQWNEIDIGSSNDGLYTATIHYNHVHDYTLIPPVTVEPTCTTVGYTQYTCSLGETYTEYSPALGHLEGEVLETVQPTCEEEGYVPVLCPRCKDTYKTDIVAPLGHECTIVGNTIAPTCTTEGYTQMQCIRCDYTEKSNITIALGHDMVVVPAVEPTCTEPGLTVGTVCSRCALVGVKQTVAPATGHSYVDGVCSSCGIDGVDFIAIKKLPSKLYYQAGEELDLSGLVLLATQKNGVTMDVTEGYTVSCFDSSVAGKQTLTVTFKSCTTAFDVLVIGAADAVIDSNCNSYPTLTDALAAAAPGCKLTLLQPIAESATVSKTIALDLNGFCVSGTLTVEDGCTLYGTDSQTDDYTVKDAYGYGKLTNVVLKGTGKLLGLPEESQLAMHGYLLVTEDDGASFHCVNLKLTAMTLRATEAGIYFKSGFAGDELVAENVKQFGVALSVQGAPTATTMKPGQYSIFTDFRAGAQDQDTTSTLLRGVMKSANSNYTNQRNANMPIYGRAYILTNEGEYLFGAAASRSFKTQVEAGDAVWNTLSDDQKASLVQLYKDFTGVMESWTLPNVKANLA